MTNIRADEILPSPHAGRWQQSLWRYHVIVGQGLWAGTHSNVSACRDRVLLEGRIWDAPQPGVVCPRCRTIQRHYSNRLALTAPDVIARCA